MTDHGRYVLTADHGYKIAVCMNGMSELMPWEIQTDQADFGDTTDIEGTCVHGGMWVEADWQLNH